MSIPKFEQYFPSVETMNRKQRDYFAEVVRVLDDGDYEDVEGNISYLFAYIYQLLDDWEKIGFGALSERLLRIAELYADESKISNYCEDWSNDCVLGSGEYDRYLEKTEPDQLFGTRTHSSNLRLNIQQTAGLEANPIDVILMAGGRHSKFIEENGGIYRDKIFEVFDEFSAPCGGWFSLFEKWGVAKRDYPTTLFGGAALGNPPELGFDIACFYAAYSHLPEIQALAKEAETRLRHDLGLPGVGEGWVSETNLFRKLKAEFVGTRVVPHGSPSWLGRQHFDIWFPHWKIAVEYHGRQHFEPVDFFGGIDAFKLTVARDKKKAGLARRHGVKLIVVDEGSSDTELIEKIRRLVKHR